MANWKSTIKKYKPKLRVASHWKNTIRPEGKVIHGKDGAKGEKGDKGDQGIQGIKGRDGKNGLNGKDANTWHLFNDKSDKSIGKNGDLAFITKTGQVLFKENDSWIVKGQLQGKSDHRLAVGGITQQYVVQYVADYVAAHGGGGDSKVREVVAVDTTAAAAANTDYFYYVNNGVTLTLPTAVGNSNLYYIKALGASATINFTGGQTGDNSSSLSMIQDQSITLISDTANWRII